MRETDVMMPPAQDSIPLPGITTEERQSEAAHVLGGLAVALYAVSFFLPALGTASGEFLGYHAFVYSLLLVIYAPMWAANPVFWVGLVCLFRGQYRSAGMAGWIALVLALSEAWMYYSELGVGYFAWLGSMALLAATGLCGAREEDRPRRWPVLSGWQAAGEAARIASRFRR